MASIRSRNFLSKLIGVIIDPRSKKTESSNQSLGIILMKYAILASLMMFSVYASANSDVKGDVAQAVPEQYNYSEHLDIAKVINITTASDSVNSCAPVDAHMVYMDHNGVTHDLQYKMLGGDCQSG